MKTVKSAISASKTAGFHVKNVAFASFGTGLSVNLLITYLKHKKF